MDYESGDWGTVMNTEATSRQDEHRTELYGVRGWLLLLCIYLGIVMPLIAILGAIALLRQAASSPGLRGVLFADGVFDIALAALAAYAGWAMYRMRPNALKFAKAYFTIMIVLSAFGLAMLMLTPPILPRPQDNTAALSNTLRTSAMIAILWPAILSAVWLVYLQRSKRIHATYPKT